jgi:hypothetical protein
MSTLPIELFQQVFFQLHQQDKVQCMLVCRRWKVLVEQYALFHTIVIRSKHTFKQIFEKIEKDAHIASSVQQLFIGSLDKEADINALLVLLTNLKAFYFLPNTRRTCTVESGVMYPWKNSIKKLVDYSMDGPVYDLLSSNTCSSLTILAINVNDKSPEIFKNMPFLKSLVLHSFDTGFGGLETLHNYLPHLESLKIKSGKLEDAELDAASIQPAVSITECLFGFRNISGYSFSEKGNLLKYICKKYPNLSTLVYRDSGIQLNESLQNYMSFGWTPIINNLGAKLTKLSMDTSELSYDFLNILDQSGCRLTCMQFTIDSLSSLILVGNSQQARYTQTLVIKLKKEVYLGMFFWLKKFEKLRKLKLISIVVKSLYFKLDDLLDNAPPLLRTLSIVSFHINFRASCANTYPIERLTLKMARLPYNTDTFLAQHCPKLSNLKLKYCLMDSKKFDLGNLDIVHFTFGTYLTKKDIVIMVDCNGQKRSYSYKPSSLLPILHNHFETAQQRSLVVPFKLLTESKTREQINFTIKCNSLINLIL